MAEIYLARASGIQGFEKYVVLKRILPQFAENHELIRMFLQEARLVALLDHANIAQVHDIGEDAGLFFFTMEYLHGEDVRRIVKHLHEQGEGIPLAHAIHIIIDVAAGLHFAHEKQGGDGRPLGIVHRDLSPSNMVVTYAGGVKIVDFGVAKIAAGADLSAQSSLKGKIAYMSPEQITHGAIDRRSDVYALGIVLYELTTRKRMFKGANEVEAIRLAYEANVVKPTEIWPDYPPELERIVMRALERSPERRYQTAREFQLDLEAFARDRKLEISSAALAEWMEKTFGPKREIWHTLPLLSESVDLAPENTAATRKVSDEELAKLPARFGAHPRRSRRSALIATLVILLCLSVGGGALSWRHRATAESASAAGAGSGSAPVLVVAENGNVAIEASPPAAAAASPPAGSAALEHGRPATRGHGHAHAHAGRSPSAPSGAEALSSSLAKREGDIRRCFMELDGHGVGAGDVALRFEVGVDGSVTSVAVLPPAIAATPLGACLAKVGRATSFAPQAKPISFRIPLSVQLRQERAH